VTIIAFLVSRSAIPEDLDVALLVFLPYLLRLQLVADARSQAVLVLPSTIQVMLLFVCFMPRRFLYGVELSRKSGLWQLPMTGREPPPR
jgi:hypothetical protein